MSNEALAIPKTLKDLYEGRQKAVELFNAAYSTLQGIQRDLNEVASSMCPYDPLPKLNPSEFRTKLDRNLWRHAFTLIGLHQYMDAKAKDELDKELEKNMPEFNLDNVRETLLTAAQDADKMFTRGIVNVFHELSKEHKTNSNSPFKINPKAILGYFTQPGYSRGLRLNCYGTRVEKINDIDRVFKTLDGKKHHPRELESAINDAWRDLPYIYEDDYYKAKGFKNGNIHLEFKRQDLLDKVNMIIAKYYGENRLAQ